jgi:hypothetical protein
VYIPTRSPPKFSGGISRVVVPQLVSLRAQALSDACCCKAFSVGRHPASVIVAARIMEKRT